MREEDDRSGTQELKPVLQDEWAEHAVSEKSR
jgi:hypothetical protein